MSETNLVRLLAASLAHARAERAQREVAVSTQDAPSSPHLTPQSDAEGSVVAQDVRETLGAQTGTQGASEAAYEAAARAYVDGIENRYGWSAGKVEYWANEKVFRAAIDAAWPLAVAEGRRQAVEAIRARVGDIAATEWAALIVEEEGRG